MDRQLALNHIRNGKALLLWKFSHTRKLYLVENQEKKYEAFYNKKLGKVTELREANYTNSQKEIPINSLTWSKSYKPVYNKNKLYEPVEIPIVKPIFVGWKPVQKVIRAPNSDDEQDRLNWGGSNNFDNLVLACKKCNHTKADTPPADWMKIIWGDDLSKCPHKLSR